MSATECTYSSRRKSQLIRLTVAVMLSLPASLILLGAVLAKRSDYSIEPLNRASIQNQMPSPSPEIRWQTELGAPAEFPSPGAFTPESAPAQVYINFDDVPSGTLISSQYAPAIFSTDFGHYTFAFGDTYYGSSPPNHLDRGPITSFDNGGFHPLYVDFTTPVDNLKFYVIAVDEYRQGIAQVNVFRNPNHQLVGSIRVDGFGRFYIPLVDVGAKFNNVSGIEVVNITDYLGVSFDDFSFTIAPPPSPTPTPTPSPSPTPFPPSGLTLTSDVETVQLTWSDTPSNATSYMVKRRISGNPWTIIAQNIPPQTFTILGNLTVRGIHKDTDVNADTVYEYSVQAANANGVSLESNIVSGKLIASCGDYVRPRPAQQFYPDPGNGWSLDAGVSDRDGLVLSDVILNGRYMAKMMSVPYFFVKTSKMSAPQRGELTPDSEAFTVRARLKRFWTSHPFDVTVGGQYGTRYIAEYAVDRLTPTSKSCLYIIQEYDFKKQRPDDKCEPSGSLPCSRFYPKVSYRFVGRAGETLESVNIPVRLHYRVDGTIKNTIGVFQDQDSLLSTATARDMFVDFRNPLVLEGNFPVVRHGFPNGSWDNIHQTDQDFVSHPPHDLLHGIYGGCPECVHNHWRWGAFYQRAPFFFNYGTGIPYVGINSNIYTPTNQDLDLGVVRYKVGEEHPGSDYISLIETNPKESIRDWVTRFTSNTGQSPARTRVLGPADVVYWYSGTSYEPVEDLFFKHGSFFNPQAHQDMMAVNEFGSAANSAAAIEDGIRAITYGHVYKEGTTTFSYVDPTMLPSLPPGYAALDNRAYRISTEAIVSGPHVVAFDVPLINDQTTFDNLAIFHLEQDPFDPDNLVWVDDTILSPDTPAPDFTNRIVNARVNDLGYFAIGTLVQPQADPGSGDLSITLNHSPNSVVVENSLSYFLHVTNIGPQPSMSVGVVDVLPQETTFVSVSASQGTCKHKDGSVYCKLGTIASGGSADITIVANTFEDRSGIPAGGKSIVNTGVVAGENDDPNLDNNSATDSASLIPNPNARPSISITSPATGSTYAPSTSVTITATANDTDGTISKVDFYDGSTLLGTRTTTTGTQYQLAFSPASGSHSLVAVATDNGGRMNVSDPVSIFVNGNGNIAITSPSANAVFEPGSNITISANTSGSVTKVEFFANSISLGEGISTSPSVMWSSVPAGNYMLTAVVTDSSGAITTSVPVNISVTARPTVMIASPVDGMSYPLLSKVVIMATAQDSDGFVSKVDFYANGDLVGAGSFIGQDRFMVDWTDVPTGVYSLTAIATDNLGVSTTSAPITIGVNTPSPRPGEFIWFDDALPTGAVKHADGDMDWYWVDLNPAAFSGTKSHQSRNLAQVHQHYFDGATTTLPINVGDKLFTYVFLDINNMPGEIMLQWKDATGWEHRAYWGANNITLGTDSTNSRRYMGPLPRAGTWARLEVPASVIGLEGSTLNGMAFTLDGGRATFDLAGKTTANAPPPPTTAAGDFVWFDEGLPPGAVTSVIDDTWNWVTNLHYTGQSSHQTYFDPGDSKQFRSHALTGAQTPMQVNPGDVLFTYVYLGDVNSNWPPYNAPDQIMLQWYDGTSWEHRAYWGVDFMGARISNMGVHATEGQRFMGGLPPLHGWYRLEVPASYVGLEGKSVSGMAFSTYRNNTNPFVAWDRSGKAAAPTSLPRNLSATIGVWQSYSSSYGYAFETWDVPPAEHLLQKIAFYVHPNQAAGTVPMHRFRRPGNYEYFYTQCKTCPGSDWQYEGIAFYVYPDATTPGTVPLHLYHDNHSKYVLTTDYNEAVRFGLGNYDYVAGYVYATAGSVPAPPTFLRWNGIASMVWQDNSLNETGFKIEKASETQPVSWNLEGTVGPNVTSFKVGTSAYGIYRVKAFNTFGESEYSNVACGGCDEYVIMNPPDNTPPTVRITSPVDGAVVDATFAINADAFDVDGGGTIGKVEFFANAAKLGEVTDAPYVFLWNNAPTGTYTLTATATDAAGATTTSTPVSITVRADLASGLVAHWKLDENAGTTAADSSGNGHTGTFQNGPAWTSGRKNAALNFDGTDDYVGNNGISDVTNNFTLAFWAFPATTHQIDGESTSGYAGVSGQRYAFWPAWYDSGQAGVGISVGTNGVSVYEHAANYMPGTLVYPATINGWTHITLVYENKQPKLYINGVLVRTGLTSPMTLVHLNPEIFGGYVYGYYAGKLDEIKAYNRALNAAEVSALPYADGVTYVASADFSSIQGQNNWYYLDSSGNQMSYVPANSWWQNGEWSILWSSGGHPGTSFTDAVRQWVAPAAGSIHITGNASDADPGGGDGVIVSIKKGSTVLWQQTIANGDTTGVTYDITTTLAAGDQINFVINRNGNNMWDATNFDPTITFTNP